MEEELANRLESAVSRLEALSAGSHPSISSRDLSDGPMDSSISAFSDLIDNYLGKVITVAAKIGGKVLDATKVVEEAFLVQKDLLSKARKYQVVLYLIPFSLFCFKSNSI